MTPIEPVDPKIEALKSIDAGRIKQNQNTSEKGEQHHAGEIEKRDNQEKTQVHDPDKSDHQGVDKDGKRKEGHEKKDGEKDDAGENPEDAAPPAHDPFKGKRLDIKG
ncbi:MAG: hypothetical protein PHQ23_00600 [Candidatus Wallbacteria bacterium]|nr:hypothetical protein [Candidatus Wallbacteria bacterium]